jgi:hypothetical protein
MAWQAWGLNIIEALSKRLRFYFTLKGRPNATISLKGRRGFQAAARNRPSQGPAPLSKEGAGSRIGPKRSAGKEAMASPKKAGKRPEPERGGRRGQEEGRGKAGRKEAGA